MSRVTTSESALRTANSLFVDENYHEALENYNESVELDENNVEAYLKRSACLQKLGKLTDALADINAAIKLKPDNSALSKAYLRKGQICFEMEEFETAKSSFEKGQQLDSSNTTFRTWIRKCNAELEIEESMDVDTSSKQDSKPTTATQSQPSSSSQSSNQSSAPAAKPASATPVSAASSNPSSTPTTTTPATSAPSEQKIRHEWYQTPIHVFVTVFVKGAKKEQVNVEFQEKSLLVSIKLSATNEYSLDLDLADKIVTGESKFELMSTKVEIKMKKANQARWKTLEHTGEAPTKAWDNVNTPDTSVKTKKNWDKIVNDETANEKLDGDEGLNKVFQDIFSNGTDEQKKAMMKSFTESGGTVLSTNWDEVGKGEVKCTPPEGLEAKKWGED